MPWPEPDPRDIKVTRGEFWNAIASRILLAICVVILFAIAIGPLFGCSAQSQPASADFPLCGSGPRITCVVDGDTFWIDGVKVRIVDIDAPEVSEPQCAAEEALGRRATLRLQELLNEGPFEVRVSGRSEDRYGRQLRVLMRNGRSIGDQLVSEGLARTWEGRRRPWC